MKNNYLNYFKDYLIEIKITKSSGTYRFYENHLLHAGRFFYEKSITDLNDIEKTHLVDYLTHLKATVSNSTLNKRVGILKRCFLYYQIDESYIHSIKKLKEKRRTFDMINDDELKSIIQYLNILPDDVGNNLLYKGIIFIFINTGVRLTELYNIEKKNVKVKDFEILLTKTKSGNDRVVYFRPVIKNIIIKLLQLETDHKYLLHNNLRNRPVNYSDIKYIFLKLKDILKIKKLHPHMFRHTFATKLLQNGVDIKSVMDLMGHTNLSTTQRYQHSSKEHTKKSYLEKYEY